MGEDRPNRGSDQHVPDHVAQLVYGSLGFNATCTAILDHRAPCVLLATGTRPRDPYSLVSLDTGRTVSRHTEHDAAAARLAELTRPAGIRE